jgi:hypothetical protein
MFPRVIPLLMIACFCLLAGCTENGEENFGEYYEYTFTDRLNVIMSGNSIHVLLLEVPTTLNFLQLIPVQLKDDGGLQDTIKFRITVQYGGYSPFPKLKRGIHVVQDSIILRYNRAMDTLELHSVGINEINTSPRITYCAVQNVEIFKAPGRNLTFESRLLR